MRRVNAGAVLLAVLLLTTASAWAAQPSLIGPTGLLTVPTADVLGIMDWNVGATQVWADGGADESVMFASLGLLPKLEIGVSRFEPENVEAETLINAKLHLLSLPGQFSVAAGMIDVTDQVERSAYVVASHTLGAGVLTPHGQISEPRVHFGIGGGQFDGLLAGISATVARKADVMAEYNGEEFNVGVRWPLLPRVSVTVATLDTFDDLAAGVSLISPW